MKKSFEKTLPDGYREAMVIDAKNSKTAGIMNIAALLAIAVITFAAWAIIRPQNYFENHSFVRSGILIAVIAVYVAAHELVHGLAYKLMTHQKLTFGMSISVAYCGVPDIFVYRTTAIAALLAPFTVFTVIFGAAAFLFSDPWNQMTAAFMLAMHIGGCAGDLYDTFIYLSKFKDPATLMRDTGPKQTFYVK